MNAKNVSLLLMAAVTLASSAAWGQVQQVQQGRALDANNQVGAGGSNQPIPGYTPINGNDVISGNVSGLKYFHGGTQVRNPYEFQGTLGSASLSSFARQSAGGGPGGYSSGLDSAYYNPSSTVSRGATGFNPGMVGNGWDSRFVPRSTISPLVSAPIAASTPMAAGLPFRAFDRMDEAAQAAQLPSDMPGGAISSPLFFLRPNAASTAIDASVKSEKIEGKAGTGPDATDKQSADNTGDQVGAALTGKLPGSTRISGQAENRSVLAERVNMRVSDTYQSLLDELKKAEDAAGSTETGETKNATASKGPPTPGKTGAPKVAGLTPGSDNTKMPQLEIDPLTGQTRVVRTPKDLAKEGFQTENPALPGYQSRGAKEAMEPRPTKVLKAGQAVKPLESFAGGQMTPFNDLMKKAEGLLQEGKYFDAAEAYQSALVSEPNNALGILGRAHAELGAGMYESSAWDLKYLYGRKPEMTAVRYDLGKYLPQDRQEFLLKDLMALSQKKGAADTASFLYCYLCYHTRRDDALAAELERWSLRDAKDPWLDVAQRAWGK